jgi:hypothetical protein
MKPKLHKWKRNVLLCAGSALLLVALGFATAHETRQLGAGEKATVTGAILSRDGDLISVLDKKSSEIVVVNINDNTKIERKQHVPAERQQPEPARSSVLRYRRRTCRPVHLR